MKDTLRSTLLATLIPLALLGIYWLCESVWFQWLYATAPVAIVTAAVALIAFIWGLIAKKPWLVIALTGTTLFSVTSLAVVTRMLKQLPML